MDTLAHFAAVLGPAYIAAACGFFWARAGKTFDQSVVAALVYNIGAPALVIGSLARAGLAHDAILEMALAALAALAIIAIVAAAILALSRRRMRLALPAVVFPMGGGMGLCIAWLWFGDKGLALAAVFFAVSIVLAMTLGASLSAGRPGFVPVLRWPAPWLVLAALALMLTGWTMPRWVLNTTGLLGGLVVALQLLSIGAVLAQHGRRITRAGFGLGALRVALGIAAGFGVAALMGLEGPARAALVLQCAMPLSLIAYLVAARQDQDENEIAGALASSIILALVALPALILLL